jgi:hypothetical protein
MYELTQLGYTLMNNTSNLNPETSWARIVFKYKQEKQSGNTCKALCKSHGGGCFQYCEYKLLKCAFIVVYVWLCL